MKLVYFIGVVVVLLTVCKFLWGGPMAVTDPRGQGVTIEAWSCRASRFVRIDPGTRRFRGG